MRRSVAPASRRAARPSRSAARSRRCARRSRTSPPASSSSVVVIFLLLAANFQSLRLAFVVVSTVPAVLAGVVLMLRAHRDDAERAVVHGGDHGDRRGRRERDPARHVCRAGAPARRIAAATRRIDAARARMRPVLMTSAAMIAGMVPMALALGEGAEATAPLGRAVIGGLAAATIATLDRAAVGVLARAAVGARGVAVAGSGRSRECLSERWVGHDDAEDGPVARARITCCSVLVMIARCRVRRQWCGRPRAQAATAAAGPDRRLMWRGSSSNRSTSSCRCQVN